MVKGPTLADVLAAPDDLDLRMVWADTLQQQGDPRGELVAIQLAPRTYASWVRERELVETFGTAWSGPLAKYFASPVFEGGLFVGGRLVGRDLAFSEPEWRSITTVTGQNWIDLLDQPHVPLRRVLDVRERELVLRVNAGALSQLVEVGLWLERDAQYDLSHALASLPSLRRLHFGDLRDDVASELADSEVLARIEQLRLTATVYNDSYVDPLIELAAASRGVLREVVLEQDVGWRVTLRRERPGPFTEVVAWWRHHDRPQTPLQLVGTCGWILRRVDRSQVRSLSIQIGRQLRPRSHELHVLTSLLADTQLERCEVPWPRPPQVAKLVGARTWAFEIARCNTVDRVEAVWTVFGSELGVVWDALSVGGRTPTKLSKQPITAISQRLANGGVSLQRLGSTDDVELESHRIRGSVASARSPQELANWFAAAVARLEPEGLATCGLADVATSRKIDLETYGVARSGWIVVLSPVLSNGLTVDHLAALGAIPIACDRVAFTLGNDPSAIEVRRFSRGLVAILDDLRAADAPPWFARTVRDYVAPIAQRRRLSQTCDHPLRLAWGDDIVVRLDNTTGPWRMAVKGAIGAKGRFHPSPPVVSSADEVVAELKEHAEVFEETELDV